MQSEDLTESTTATAVYAPIACGLVRAMGVAHLYPADHQRFALLADPLVERVRAVSAQGRPLVFEVDETGLWVDGQALGADAEGVEVLRSALFELGIACLEIDAGARRRDLHALTARISQGKRRLDTVGFVRDLEFEDLPAAVRARRREFGRRVNAGESGAGPSLNLSLSGGAPRPGPGPGPGGSGGVGVPGVNGVDRRALQAPSEADEAHSLILKDGEPGGIGAGAPEAATPIEAPPADGPKLILRNPGAIEPAEGGGAAAGGLQQALEQGADALGEALDAGPAGDAVGELFDEWEQGDAPAAPATDPATEPAEEQRTTEQLSFERDGCELTVAELRQRIDANALRGDPLTSYDPDDAGEELSILLHVLLSTSDPAVRRGVGVGLHRVLSAQFDGAAAEIVHEALQAMLAIADPGQVDATLPLIISPLRRAHGASVGGMLLELITRGPAEGLGLLWPHMANELLLGVDREERAVADAMHELVGRIPTEVLQAGVPRLTSLEAVRSGRYAKAIQEEPRQQLAELMAEVLDSGDADELGHFLLRGFRARGPRRSAEVALQTFDTCNPSCRRLVSALLRDHSRGRATRAANEIAGRLLLHTLHRVPQHRREDRTTQLCIRALGELRHRPARSLLQQIVRERRALVVPAWPNACREAAHVALRAMGGE